MSAPAIELRGLSFAYPDGRRALDGIDLRVEPGERVALLGPNGAGKTTLILHLNGILGTERGEHGEHGEHGGVRIGGTEVTRATRREVRRRVAIAFQDADDQLFMPTVGQDVAFGPANHGLRGEALARRVADALATVGMAGAADVAPHHLSAGERRRVAIAGVLACDPEVLVLDEPTSSLDPASRRELAELIAGLELTVLLATHDLPFALELCPRAAILDRGRIVADGPTGSLLADDELLRAHRLELPYGFAVPVTPTHPG